jgi:hypothetical protein
MIDQNQHLQTFTRLDLFPKHFQNNIQIVRILEWNVEEHKNIGKSCKEDQKTKKTKKN